MGHTVEAVFPRVHSGASRHVEHGCDVKEEWELAIVSANMQSKHNGVGRADEGGYTLFEIGWVTSSVVRPGSVGEMMVDGWSHDNDD